MRLPLPISLSLLFLTAQAVRAQFAPVDDFFNSGAQFYISNNIPSALEQVEAGLKIYPDDEKLKKLEELLKQQQQQQDQKNQNQQNQSQQQQKSDGQKKQQQQNQQEQESSDKDSQDRQKPDEQKKDHSGEKKDDQHKQAEPRKPSADKKEDAKPDKPEVAGRPAAPGQMTPEEAKRLLDAQKGDEKVLQLQPKGKPEPPNRPVKDW